MTVLCVSLLVLGALLFAAGAAGAPKHRLLPTVTLPKRAAGAVRLKVRLGGRAASFAVTVNGRRARLRRGPNQPTSWRPGTTVGSPGWRRARVKTKPAKMTTIPLSADDGLHPGRNRVVVSASWRRGGHVARVVRHVWMSPAIPLVAAGPDRRTTAGQTVRLDASGSVPATAHERLRYRWHIVTAPGLRGKARGVRARAASEPGVRLIDATGAEPQLVTQSPGIYQVALQLEPPPAGSAASPLLSLEEPPTDVVTIEADENVMPYGAAIKTGPTADGGWETKIEGSSIGGPGDESLASSSGQFQIIRLDRYTLAKQSVKVESGEVSNCLNASEEAEKAPVSEMVIMTGYCHMLLWPYKTPEQLTIIMSDGHLLDVNGNQSIGEGPGGVSALLRRSVGDGGRRLYGVVFPQTVEYATYEKEGSSLYTEVGGTKTPITLEPGATKGIVVTALNPALERIGSLSTTYSLPGPGGEAATLASLAGRLEAITKGDPAGVLMLQTIGSPKNSGAAWEQVGIQLKNFGGTPALWRGLKGEGNYALVGVNYSGNESKNIREESTEEQDGQTEGAEAEPALKEFLGTARGVLGYGSGGYPVIRASNPLPSGNAGELTVLLEAQPQPWPASGGTGEKSALEWISKELDLGAETDEPGQCFSHKGWDVRAVYCNTNIEKWQRYAEMLPKAEACAKGAASLGSFSARQCEAVSTQLGKEFEEILTVRQFLANLKEPFTQNQGSSDNQILLALEKVEKEIKKSEPADGPLKGIPGEGMLDGFATVFQNADWEVSGVAVAAGIVESLFNIFFESSEAAEGEPATEPFFVPNRWEIAKLGIKRLNDATRGIAVVEALILTDWNKLDTVATKAEHAWGITSETTAQNAELFRRGTEVWLYETIIPSAYTMVRVPLRWWEANQKGLEELECGEKSDLQRQQFWKPFAGFPEALDFFPPGFAGAQALGNANGGGNLETPTETLTKSLFETYPKGAGIERETFFTWGWSQKETTLEEILEKKGLEK